MFGSQKHFDFGILALVVFSGGGFRACGCGQFGRSRPRLLLANSGSDSGSAVCSGRVAARFVRRGDFVGPGVSTTVDLDDRAYGSGSMSGEGRFWMIWC